MKTAIESLFQAMMLDGWFTATSGDVGSPTGVFGYVTNRRTELDSIRDAFADDIAEHGNPTDEELTGSFVVLWDDQGNVTIERYAGLAADGSLDPYNDGAARERFKALDAQYVAWLEDAEQ